MIESDAMPAPVVAPARPAFRTAGALTAADLLASFCAARSGATLRLYRGALERFAAFLGVVASDLAPTLCAGGLGWTNAKLRQHLGELLAAGAAPATVNTAIKAVRALLAEARDLELVSWVPTVKLLKAPPRDMRGPSLPELRRVLAAAGAARAPGKAARDRALVVLGFGMALRRAEIAALDLADVERDAAGGVVALQVLRKGQRQRVRRTVPSAAAAALAAWIAARGEAPGALFQNFDRAGKGARLTGNGVYAILGALGRRAGVALRPHGLRHASITTALDLGLDVRVVRHHSGHASVQTLLAYDDARQDFAGQVAERVAAVL